MEKYNRDQYIPSPAGGGADPASTVRSFDLRNLQAHFYENPYPTYRALREQSPVHPLPGGGYFLSRYQDCVAVYKDPRLFSSDKKAEFLPKYGETPLYEHHTTSLVFNDPPLHTRVRKIIAGALNPRAVAEMEEPVVALVDSLLDRMARKSEVDLIADLASAVPVEVIGNLLAVPHDEREPLRAWSLAILGALEPVLSPEQMQAGNDAVIAFCDYLRTLIDRRRRDPGDPDRDVLTRLIQGERNGETLTERELLHNVIFILNAGHETTTNLIGNGLYVLQEWPDAKAQLLASRDKPQAVRLAVEEMLRFESSNQLGNRVTTAQVQLGGVDMAAGTFVTLGIGAANRDPDEFADPERFDITREPNRHLAFGSGAHACAGLSVARLEGRIAIGRFLARFPEYRLRGSAVRGGRARFRGFLSIPVELG